MPTDSPELEDQEFFIVQHTVAERANTEGAVYGGPYLDDVQRVQAEEQRAAVEDRKPDFDNAPAIAGTPLLTAKQINGDGFVNDAKPDAVLPVVVGDPIKDDDGNPTGEKKYLKSKKNKVTPAKKDATDKAATKKAVAAETASK